MHIIFLDSSQDWLTIKTDLILHLPIAWLFQHLNLFFVLEEKKKANCNFSSQYPLIQKFRNTSHLSHLCCRCCTSFLGNNPHQQWANISTAATSRTSETRPRETKKGICKRQDGKSVSVLNKGFFRRTGHHEDKSLA